MPLKIENRRNIINTPLYIACYLSSTYLYVGTWTGCLWNTIRQKDTVSHGGSSRSGCPYGVCALPTEFPMTVRFVRAWEHDGSWRLRHNTPHQEKYSTTLSYVALYLMSSKHCVVFSWHALMVFSLRPSNSCVWKAFLLTIEFIYIPFNSLRPCLCLFCRIIFEILPSYFTIFSLVSFPTFKTFKTKLLFL